MSNGNRIMITFAIFGLAMSCPTDSAALRRKNAMNPPSSVSHLSDYGPFGTSGSIGEGLPKSTLHAIRFRKIAAATGAELRVRAIALTLCGTQCEAGGLTHH